MRTLFQNYRGNYLNRNLVTISVLFFLVNLSLIILGFYYYSNQKEIMVSESYANLKSNADFNRFQISNWLKERFNHIEVLNSNSPLIKKLESTSSLPNNLLELKEWFTALKTYYFYEDIIVADTTGKIIYSDSSPVIKLSVIDSILCSKSAATNSILFSDSDKKYGVKNLLAFYMPIGKHQVSSDRIKSVLILKVNPKPSFTSLLNRHADRTTSMESLLLKSGKDEVIYLNDFKHSSKEQAMLKDSNRKALISTSMNKARMGFVEGVDYKNDDVIAVLQTIPNTTWTLITKIDKSEFYASINDLAKLIIMTLISVCLLFTVALIFIWRKNVVASYKELYLAELERNKSEKRFDTLIRGVKDYAIYILDLKGIIMSWNYGIELIQGFKENEVIEKHFSMFYLPEEKDQNKPAKSLQLATEKGSYEEEGWRLKKDGTKFWAYIVITALKDNEDNIYGYLKMCRDLTESKNLERNLIEARDLQLKLITDFPNPIWRSGPDGKYDYFNKAWLEFTGKKLEQEIGEGWIENIHPEDQSRVVSDYYSSFKKEKSFVFEYRLKNYKGDYKWTIDYGIPFYNLEGKFTGYIGSCYDIDDRKKYEETINSLLRISEKLYSSLEIDQILDSLVVESIKLVDAESGFASITDGERFIAKRYFNQDHWEFLKLTWELESNLSNQFRNRKEGYIVNKAEIDALIHPELKEKYLISQAISVPLYGANGELIGFFETHNKKNGNGYNLNDLNHVKALARNASISLAKSLSIEQLRKTELQLRNSESELRQLAAQLQYVRETERHHLAREVHDELGQLFTGINLNILYLRDIIDNKNENFGIHKIIDELNEVKKMVDKGIQSVRDISAGLRSYVLEHLGLVHAIREYCKEFQRVSNINCTITSYSDDINLSEEKNIAIYRIIQESLTNAMRHSKASEIKIEFLKNNNSIEILVEDNGVGFEENKPRKRKTFGILGMKERALYLNGQLTISSKPGSGTIIKISLPEIETANKGN